MVSSQYTSSQTSSGSANRDRRGFLGRNFLLIAGVALFVSFWMLLYTFVVYQPNYAAKATVIIKDSAITSRYVEPDQYYAMQTTSSSSSNPVLNTMGILKSHTISEALWTYFRTHQPQELKKNKIKTQAQWNQFFQDGSAFIKAKNQPGTDLISIQFSWSNPTIAKEALDVVVKAFQESSRDLNKAEQISRTLFLAKQVAELESQVEAIRHEKSKYRSQKHTISMRREEDDLAGSRMELSNRLNQLEAQALGKENQVRGYQKMLGMSSEQAVKASALGQNSTMSKLQDELYRLQQLHSLLSSSLTDSNPKVQEVQSQIERVQANIADERTRTLGEKSGGQKGDVVADATRARVIDVMLQAQGEARDFRAQAAVTRARLKQIDQDIQKYPTVAEGLSNIEQKEASLSTALDQLRQKVMEGRIKEEQTLSNVFIVDAPRLPQKAQFPTQLHLVVISLMLGLGTGLATAFAKEQVFSPQGARSSVWLEPIEDDRTENAQSEEDASEAYTSDAHEVYASEAAINPDTEIHAEAEATPSSSAESHAEPHALLIPETPERRAIYGEDAEGEASAGTPSSITPAYPRVPEVLSPKQQALLDALRPSLTPENPPTNNSVNHPLSQSVQDAAMQPPPILALISPPPSDAYPQHGQVAYQSSYADADLLPPDPAPPLSKHLRLVPPSPTQTQPATTQEPALAPLEPVSQEQGGADITIPALHLAEEFSSASDDVLSSSSSAARHSESSQADPADASGVEVSRTETPPVRRIRRLPAFLLEDLDGKHGHGKNADAHTNGKNSNRNDANGRPLETYIPVTPDAYLVMPEDLRKDIAPWSVPPQAESDMGSDMDANADGAYTANHDAVHYVMDDAQVDDASLDPQEASMPLPAAGPAVGMDNPLTSQRQPGAMFPALPPRGLGKHLNQKAESLFGLASRKHKSEPIPGSLSRAMQNLTGRPVPAHSEAD